MKPAFPHFTQAQRRALNFTGVSPMSRDASHPCLKPYTEGEGTHDKQVSVFEDRPEPHPAWVSGELIAVFRTLVVIDRPYNSQFRISIRCLSSNSPVV